LNKAVLQENLLKVKAQIEEACFKSGVNSSGVTLLAVSKAHSCAAIQSVFEAGQLDFGENYVQEANRKQKELSLLPIRWHFIGQLQKNKVKFVVGAFDLIHSVDSIELAKKISLSAQSLGIQQKILLEVNLNDEQTKGGFPKQLMSTIFPEIVALPNLKLAGLMAFPPLFANPELVRPFFRELSFLFHNLKERLSENQVPTWHYLSMGTTHDFTIALEEGANLVRIGTALFGERPHLANDQKDSAKD
jgi:pyridoxal phosphate enzyme (YggS family)